MWGRNSVGISGLKIVLPTVISKYNYYTIGKISLRTMHNNNDDENRNRNPNPNAPRECSSKISSSSCRRQIQILDGDGWDAWWKEGATPWDIGTPTPVLLHLHRTQSLPNGTALIPGCGSGHDVVAIASPERYVIGLDISLTAINRAIKMSSSHPNSNYFTFLKTDFFTWNPTHLFDLIFDYTFFCAIEPQLRSAWAQKIRDILKPDGELITLIFPISDHAGGPPYKVSVSDYEEALHPMGFKAISIVDNELAVGPRKVKKERILRKWHKSKANFLRIPSLSSV